MRKLLIVAVLATAALGGAAACASSTPGSSPTSTPPASSASDQTKAVCDEAIAFEKQQGSSMVAKVQQALADMAAGKTVDPAQLQADLLKMQQDWTTKFNELSAKPIKPEVKTAITNFVTNLQQIAQSSNAASMAQAQAKLTELDQALSTACAGSA
jgi:ABC-type glycerol-3-phosphate transport system substrate-binding protein